MGSILRSREGGEYRNGCRKSRGGCNPGALSRKLPALKAAEDNYPTTSPRAATPARPPASSSASAQTRASASPPSDERVCPDGKLNSLRLFFPHEVKENDNSTFEPFFGINRTRTTPSVPTRPAR